MSRAATSPQDARLWVVLPQMVSRLSAVYVFALAARSLDADLLGVLAIATAVTAGAAAMVPAVVGKPLAVLRSAHDQARDAPRARSFAVLAAAAAGLVLALASSVAEGDVRLALQAAAIGVPAATAVESHYWTAVFLRGRRRAGLGVSAAYATQAAGVTLGAAVAGPTGLVLSPFLGLAAAGAVLAVLDGGLSMSSAAAWASATARRTWVPYVMGVSAAAALAQAIPIVLALAAGLAAASAYRAAELVFGMTNLLIGIVVQTQLTEDTADPRRTFARWATLLAAVAAINGAVLGALPVSVLEQVVGPVAVDLRAVLGPFTGLRAALGVASVGSVLLLRRMSPRTVGLLGVGGAALSGALLLLGAVLGGLLGGVSGLAVAEVAVATFFARRLLHRTRAGVAPVRGGGAGA